MNQHSMSVPVNLSGCPSESLRRLAHYLSAMETHMNHTHQESQNESVPNSPTGRGAGRMPHSTPFPPRNSPSSGIHDMQHGTEFRSSYGHPLDFPIRFPNRDLGPREFISSFEYILHLSSQLVKCQDAYIKLLTTLLVESNEKEKKRMREQRMSERHLPNNVYGPLHGRRARYRTSSHRS